MYLQHSMQYKLQWHYSGRMIKHTRKLSTLYLTFHSDDRYPLYSSKNTFRTQNVFQPFTSPPKLSLRFHFSDSQGMWEKKGSHRGYEVKFCISGRTTFYVSQHTSQTHSALQYGWLFILEPGLGCYLSFYW
jgi:hypothetical protein